MSAKALATIADAVHAMLDWLYPAHCYHCEASLSGTSSRVLCRSCLEQLESTRVKAPMCSRCGLSLQTSSDTLCIHCIERPPHFDLARAIFPYSGPAATLILRFKFSGEYFIGPKLMRRAISLGWLSDGLKQTDAILPVPLHPKRERQRGYNQALLLARVLAKHFNCSILPHGLRRIRHTGQQTGLTGTKRWENVKGAFSAGKTSVAGLRLLLIDDVMTTGATTSECARVLKKAGAASVTVLTLARTHP